MHFPRKKINNVNFDWINYIKKSKNISRNTDFNESLLSLSFIKKITPEYKLIHGNTGNLAGLPKCVALKIVN